MPEERPPGYEAARLLALAGSGGGPAFIHVTGDEQRAEEIARFIAAVAPDLRPEVFPPWDCLPYDAASPSRAAMGRRMRVLRKARQGRGAAPRLVVTTPAALLQRVPPPSSIRCFELRLGAALDTASFEDFCLRAGYAADERVDEPGEVAFRGAVIDIFPGARRWPFRIETNGRIEAIRSYDPVTQRSVEEVPALAIDAVSELPHAASAGDAPERGAEHRLPDFHPQLATLIDHFPGALLAISPAAEAGCRTALAQIAEAHLDRLRGDAGCEGSRPIPPDRLYLTEAERAALIDASESVADGAGFEPVPDFAAVPRPRREFGDFVRRQAGLGRRVLLVAPSERDGREMAARARRALDRAPEPVAGWRAALEAAAGSLLALDAPLERGFVDGAAGLAVVTARDLLGNRAERAEAAPTAAAPWRTELAEFHLGDTVVHADHGVARLEGLERIGSDTVAGEAIRLVFARDQALLVPVAEAGRLWRYGSAEGGVTLDRLDTDGWEKRRARIAKGLAETARGLIAAAADRRSRAAAKLVPPPRRYGRFVARFPFTETPDQRRAIEAVLADMASGLPMNRLVVGDVGFGKTEVALRAAATAAFAGKQVAVVAPTTVLARQHFHTFRRRFAELGVEVAHLSRLNGAREARRVKEGLKDGGIGVVIGTHALLGKGIAFANLGLLVVDEEQRFGAEHKRRLRALGEDAHVLAMTATPIPRTLQAALVGLQDLSTLATPPARRRPIRTFVAERDAATMRLALLRERRRGGQSFVVVPRVEDIAAVGASLAELVPALDLRIAHGRLPASEIDEALVGFAEGVGDVLLATSIIESGLDVPRANTMIVLRPDLFGLAQLHQLRGRVGRSNLQAYCYLLSEPGEALPDATAKRLGTLQALDRLGAGLAISANDLELRGGGELFGDAQAGHVKLIGLALYQDLLAEALRAERGEPANREVELQIEATGYLPSDYIPEPEVRINLYHRLARPTRPSEADSLAEEIADRFGPAPEPVRDLLALAQIRALAGSLGVSKVATGPQAIALDFEPGLQVEDAFADALRALAPDLEWTGARLILRRPSESAEARRKLALDLLRDLA